MKAKCLLFLLLCFFSVTSFSQDEKQNIVSVLNKFFQAIENKDGVAMQECFTANNIVQTVSWKYEEYYVQNESLSEYISLLNSTPRMLKQEVNIESISFDNRLATAWVPYKNLVDGTLTHCGVNSFQLVKLASGWKIQYYIDTRSRYCGLTAENKPASGSNTKASKSIIFMKKKNGVFYIPCKVNGVDLDFVFDTGASDVTISLAEAQFMAKNGLLKSSDILGNTKFSTADGSVSSGTNIIIRELSVGPFTLYNVRASIVHSLNAPLLLGQTALSRFGKFTFDYQGNKLEINK